MGSGHILKTEPTEFDSRLYMENEQKKEVRRFCLKERSR